jgi:hypothetical protein
LISFHKFFSTQHNNIFQATHCKMLSAEVLHALLSPDYGVRFQAEAVYNSISVPERIQALMNHLLALSRSSNDTAHDDGVAMLTAVLLRRDILKLTDSSMLNDLVDPLLQCYNCSSSTTTKLQIGHCLAEVCSSLSIISGEASAVPVMAKIVGAVNTQEIIVLRLLASLADRAPMAFAKVAVPSLSRLVDNTNHAAVPQTLATITQVVVNGAIATTVDSVSLVRMTPNLDELVVDGNSVASSLGETCLLPLLGSISACTNDDETAQRESLQSLSQAALSCPSLLAGNSNVLQAVVQLCVGVAHSTACATTTSSHRIDRAPVALAALEVLSGLLSVGDVRHRILAPSMAEQIAQQAIPICAQIMAQGVDAESVPEWASEPATLVEDGMEDETDEVLFAESLMESFLQNLAAAALTVTMPLVQQLLQNSNDWRNARAGLAMLEAGLVAAPVSIATHVPEIIKAAVAMAEQYSSESNYNPRVQYHAIRLLGALCETHSSVRSMYGQAILAQMATALGSPVGKVSSMGSLGIVAFCRGNSNGDGDELDETQFLGPYLSELMQALMHPLSINGVDTGSVTVRVRAMNAVACLAQSSKDAFAPFYAGIMPGLLASTQVPQSEIAAAALQSLTIVGQSVGKEMFREDATKVLSSIIPALPTSGNAQGASSLATEDLLTACARIASVLEEDFAPYLEALLPALYSQAMASADVSIVEGSEADMQNEAANDGAEGMTVALPGRGFQRITINTTAIQEKAGNNRVMYELAKALGATFGPHVQQAIEVFAPLVNFRYSADVRSTAAQTLSALFDAACEYGEQTGNVSVVRHYLPQLANAISEQIFQEDPSDADALYASADSLSEIFYIVFQYRNNPLGRDMLSGLSMGQIEDVVMRCMQTMIACLDRRSNLTNILGRNLTGEDEKEDYNAQLRAEDGLLTPLVDSIGYLLKFSRSDFVPIFEKHVVPVLVKYLSSTADVRASIASMCLFDDCVEYCGQDAAALYSPLLLQGVMTVFQDPSKYDRDFVQAAVYGVCQISRYAPNTILAPHVQTIVRQLVMLSQGRKEDAGDALYLHELSVSALASLTLFGPFSDLKFVNRESVVTIFLDNLPLEEDEDEAKICHAGLCTLIENGSLDLVAEADKITRIIEAIFSDVQESSLDVATPETCERLSNIMNLMHKQNP